MFKGTQKNSFALQKSTKLKTGDKKDKKNKKPTSDLTVQYNQTLKLSSSCFCDWTWQLHIYTEWTLTNSKMVI